LTEEKKIFNISSKLTSYGLKFTVHLISLIFAGAVPVFIFMNRSGWLTLKIDQPLMYFADPLYYANMVANAQQGHPLTGENLGGATGQQYSMSAYGFEWVQSLFVSWFANSQEGPWLAQNRFFIYTIIATSITAFLALRYLGTSILYSAIGGMTYSLIPDHQPYSVGLANMSVLPIALAIIWKIQTGTSVEDLFPFLFKQNSKKTTRKLISIVILICIAFFELSAAAYYILLITVLASSICLILLTFPGNLRKIGNYTIFICTQLFALVICLAPIIYNRISNGLTFSEPSTGDRRPFAAYANGGDLISLLSPFSERSILYKILSKFGVYENFYKEYTTSTITSGTEYIIHPFGLILFLLFPFLFYIMVKNNYKKTQLHFYDRYSDAQKAGLFLVIISLCWYLRGGFGTLFSFAFPYIRGYARFNSIVTFYLIAVFGVFITKKIASNIVVTISMVLVLVDTSSSIPKIIQDNSRSIEKIIGNDEIPGSASSINNLEFTSLGYLGTQKLQDYANLYLPKGCVIFVAPLVRFPVDFAIGIPSYYTYDLIKPGISGSHQKWTAGGITGTPANQYFEELWPAYANSNFKALNSAFTNSNVCGVIVFEKIADAVFEGGNAIGYKFPSARMILENLNNLYGKPCYLDSTAKVTLFCKPVD